MRDALKFAQIPKFPFFFFVVRPHSRARRKPWGCGGGLYSGIVDEAVFKMFCVEYARSSSSAAQRAARSAQRASQVKFLLSTQIQNSPPWCAPPLALWLKE